ncbi:MAG: hypothetical protein V3S08_00725 [Phycisphaerales bacterium]
MTDSRTDEVAREAARLMASSRSGSIGEAIRAAASALGYHDVDLPGHGRVRKHAQGLAMQALGREGYARSVDDVWQAAERIMTVLTEAIPDAEPLLAGRAAQGLIDGGVTLHVRVYTHASIGDIAQTLVDFGYDEPGFETAATRFGRLDRLRLADEGVEILLTRCPPDVVGRSAVDLFTGKPVRTATLAGLRGKLR